MLGIPRPGSLRNELCLADARPGLPWAVGGQAPRAACRARDPHTLGPCRAPSAARSCTDPHTRGHGGPPTCSDARVTLQHRRRGRRAPATGTPRPDVDRPGEGQRRRGLRGSAARATAAARPNRKSSGTPPGARACAPAQRPAPTRRITRRKTAHGALNRPSQAVSAYPAPTAVTRQHRPRHRRRHHGAGRHLRS